MASDPQHYQKLIASVAPRVIDMDNVKKGLLCQLFGGVSKSTAAALGGDSTSRWAGQHSRAWGFVQGLVWFGGEGRVSAPAGGLLPGSTIGFKVWGYLVWG